MKHFAFQAFQNFSRGSGLELRALHATFFRNWLQNVAWSKRPMEKLVSLGARQSPN
jgi:hypothetical protein